MTVLEALKALRRLWPVAVACAVVAGALMWIITPVTINTERQVANFDAIATLLVVPRGDASAELGGGDDRAPASPSLAPTAAASPRAATPSASVTPSEAPSSARSGMDSALALNRVALLVRTGEIPHIAAQKLGYSGNPAVLAELVRVQADGDSSSVTVAMTSKDSRPAVETVNAFAQAAVEYFAGPGEGIGVDVLLLEEATALPNETTEAYVAPPSKWGRTVLAGIVGLVLGAGLVLIVDQLDPRLQTRRQVARALALPVLAEIPRRRRGAQSAHGVAVLDDPRGAEADGYRVLASGVLHARAEKVREGRADSAFVIVVTALAGGADEVVSNLAAAVAATTRVLVVDGDLHSSGLAEQLDVPEMEGVSDYLMSADGEFRRFVHPSRAPGVDVVTAGTNTGQSVMVTSRLGQALPAAEELADIVILKAPPLLAASEVFDFLPLADIVLVSVRSGRLEPAAAARARELVHRFPHADAGAVLLDLRREHAVARRTRT